MSNTEQIPERAGKPKRRMGRIVGAVVALGVLALFVALTVWAARPRWYTFVSTPSRTTPAWSLAMQVPVGWECQQDHPFHDVTGANFIFMRLHRKPPTGIVRWWNEKVLRLHTSQHPSEQNRIVMGVERSDPGPSFFKNAMQDIPGYASIGYAASVRTFTHTLGPGLDIMIARHGSGPRRLFFERADHKQILPRIHQDRSYLWIEVARYSLDSASNADFDRNQSTWNEIVRSIRVVQK